MNYLITWFYAENKDDESFYPSVGGNTSSPEFHRVYWKCIFDFYKSAILTNGHEISYMFFTNVPHIPTDVDGVNLEIFFREHDIRIKQLELSKRTPSDWYGAWRNQLYEFDVLRELSKEDGNSYLILDSDILIRKSLLPVFDDIAGNGAVCYECGYRVDQNINGISIEQMRSLYDEIYGGGGQPTCLLWRGIYRHNVGNCKQVA